ncbi:preprotein translocase subunit SecF [Candidatus Woesearchaeota archaeon]|nr:preprotein translocase subunit SecF [Candidatus Woesearchaeota archaeon]
MSKKRQRREKARQKYMKDAFKTEKEVSKPEKAIKEREGILGKLQSVYEKDYKKLMILTFLMLILGFVQIGYQTATTGDFVSKGVSLKGGVTVTITDPSMDAPELEEFLESSFPDKDIIVRTLAGLGDSRSLTVEADITDNNEVSRLESVIVEQLGLSSEDYSISFVGSSLGSNFFRQTIIAVIVAFIAMAIVVFAYFRVPIPSIAVIISALSDIVVTIAVINMLGIKISTGGIAALLMLIGYSVDTDILLTTRLFKRKEGTLQQSIYSSAKTGLTMTITSIAAVTVAIMLSQSEALRQIMVILLIGLIIDIPNTWIQNTGILRWYIERRSEKEDEQA